MMQGKRGLSLELTFWLFLFFKQFHLSTAGLRWQNDVVLKHDIDVFWGFADFVVENLKTNDFSLNWGIEIPVCGCAVTKGFLAAWLWADKPANLATFALLWRFSSSTFLVVFSLPSLRIQPPKCSEKDLAGRQTWQSLSCRERGVCVAHYTLVLECARGGGGGGEGV